MDKTVVGMVMLSVLVFGGVLLFSSQKDKQITSTPTSELCVEHSSAAAHFHPHLVIKIDGVEVPIPANTNISAGCMHAIHTHDATGKLHVETPDVRDVFLRDFFTIWGKPFSKDLLLDKQVDNQHEIVLTVNGQASTEFGQLKLADGQEIMIEYRAK